MFFYIILVLWTVSWTLLMLLLVVFIPIKFRHSAIIRPWVGFTIYLAKYVCGIRWELRGVVNIPKTPCVLLSNHQSAWETFFLQIIFYPQVPVIKKELLSIPFFGQAFAKAQPIAIDRSKPKLALQQLREQGSLALKRKCWVLIFPEGTRSSCNQLGKFSRGGADLAKLAGVPVVPIAHNSGNCWLKGSWLKVPGTIIVDIMPIIETSELSIPEIGLKARKQIESALNQMASTDQT